MTEIVLTGIDGANPLGFLAALGVLNVANEQLGVEAGIRLSWRDEGYWRPVVQAKIDAFTAERLVAVLMTDRAAMADEPALDLSYGDGGAIVRDLKPPPGVYRAFASSQAAQATSDSRRGADYAAAFATDIAVDNRGNTKPTALHFTAGQQKFLEMVRALRAEVTEEDLHEALFGPWAYRRPLPVLQWDASVFRDYALRASNPSGEKKQGVPGADWLAFRGLPFIRVSPEGTRIRTTGCAGGWKSGSFRWPIWTVALSREVVTTLVQQPQLESMAALALRRRGIAVVLCSKIQRAENGGRGTFSPSAIAQGMESGEE